MSPTASSTYSTYGGSRAASLGQRIWYALVGASIGLVSSVAYRAADFPGFGAHDDVLIAVVVVLGAIIGLLAWTRFAAFLGIAAGVFVAVVGCTNVVHTPIRSWIRHDRLPPTATIDAVVVLSSGLNADGYLDPPGAQRLMSGLEMVQQTHPRLLITSRVTNHVTQRRPRTTITSDADQGAMIGVAGDTKMWRIISPVSTTHDEALRTAALLAPASSRTIVLVTSPLHTRRACATFERTGFHVFCVPSAERVYAAYSLDNPRSRLHAFLDYLYERAGMVKYRFKGWVR